MTPTLTQIVPILAPAVDGVGDYALNLARQLRQDWQIETQFVVCNPSWGDTREIEGFSALCLADRSDRALLQLLPATGSLLLHYSGYGYALRGCPRWLAAGLAAWKQGQNRALLTLFHEVYPYRRTPPWTSSFWLSPWQKRAAARLLKSSDRAIANRENYAQLLRRLSSIPLEIPVLPVFSTVGEPAMLLPWEQRKPRAVAFGHRNMRLRLYRDFLPRVLETCRCLNLDTLYDIGVPTGAIPPARAGLKIVELGVLPAAEVSAILSNARVGFLSAPTPEYFGKSTIFAAYCAHQLLCVLPQGSAQRLEGLVSGQHYWVFDGTMEPIAEVGGAAIAKNAHTWYEGHNLPTQAEFVARYLGFIDSRSRI